MTPRRAEAIAEGLFLAAILVAPWPYGSTPEPAAFLLATTLLLASSLGAFALFREGRPLPPLALPAAALLALGVLQIVLGTSAVPVWTAEAVLVLAGSLGAAVFWSHRGRDPAAARRLAGAVLFAAASQALFGAVQWQLTPDRIYGRASEFLTTPFGSYVNHNHFAGLLGMGVVLALGLAMGLAKRAGGPTPAALGLGGLAVGLAAAHLASRSRGGLVALLAGLAALAGLQRLSARRTSRKGLVLLSAGLLAVVLAGLAVVPRGTRAHLGTILRGGRDASSAYRVDTAWDTLRLIASRPLVGCGLGAFGDAFPEVKRSHGEVRTTHAESDVLEFGAEGGILGIGVLVWLAAAAAGGLRDRLAHGHDPRKKGLALGAAAACLTLGAHSLVDFNLRVPANALVFAALLGLAAAPRSDARRPGMRASWVAPGAVALLTILGAYRAWGAFSLAAAREVQDPHERIKALGGTLAKHPYLPDAYRERGLTWRALAERRREAAPGRRAKAIADLESALRLRPRWAEVWADLAWIRALEGNLEGATTAFETASRLDPTHVHIARARADFLARFPRRP